MSRSLWHFLINSTYVLLGFGAVILGYIEGKPVREWWRRHLPHGRAVITPIRYDFGKVPSLHPLECQFTLRNTGKGDLKLPFIKRETGKNL